MNWRMPNRFVFSSSQNLPLTLRLLIFLIFLSHVAFGQAPKQPNPTKAFAFIDSLLKKDNYTIEFIDFAYPKELQAIRDRLQKTLYERREWYEQYANKYYKEGSGVPYHENFGITKEEYDRIRDLDKTLPELVVVGSAQIKAVRSSNVFSFKVENNDLEYLETLNIDFGNNILSFLKDTIPYDREFNAPAKPLGEYHGYSWLKETKTDSLTTVRIEVDFGKRIEDNKTILHLKYRRINNGEIKANFDLVCYLN